jgi:hypothetical protein
MQGMFATSRRQSSWRVLLSVLCISLIVLGGIISVTHTHSKTETETSHQDCGLCVTAHMAVQVAVVVTQVTTSQVFTRVETSSPVARPQVTPQFALFSRPPPADSDRS